MQTGTTAGLEDLIARVGRGERASFDALYAATADRLHAVCLAVLRERPAAEQALEQTYLEIWQCAADYRPERLSPLCWLIVIARNRAVDAKRSRSSRPRPAPARAMACPRGPVAALSADQRRIDRTRATLNDRLAALEPEAAEAIRQVWLGGLSYADLSGDSGLPKAPLRGWFRRALAALTPGDP